MRATSQFSASTSASSANAVSLVRRCRAAATSTRATSTAMNAPCSPSPGSRPDSVAAVPFGRVRSRCKLPRHRGSRRGDDLVAKASSSIPPPKLVSLGNGGGVPIGLGSSGYSVTAAGASMTPNAGGRTVRVRLSVEYRVHSRQMLCIGGSQIPFGWSFLSIARVPMAWSPGDVWTAELDLPLGARVEYKYVILEEQDWTKHESADAEGIVEFEYRNPGDEAAGVVPDVARIQRRMAIVAWQPGANRVVQVPSEEEAASLVRGGEPVSRTPARAPARAGGPPAGFRPRTPGTPAFGRRAGGEEGPMLPSSGNGTSSGGTTSDDAESDGGSFASSSSAPSSQQPRRRRPPPDDGTREQLSLTEEGVLFLERKDVWGLPPKAAPSASASASAASLPLSSPTREGGGDLFGGGGGAKGLR